MKRTGNWIRKTTYKYLPFETYLWFLSQLYFITFNLGILKGNRLYEYPYFLKKIIKKGDICIDIGANLGYLTILFSKLVGTQGKVYAIEPVKPVLSVLRKNTKGLKNIEIFPFALGEENKLIRIGNNSIRKKGYVASGSHFVLDKDEIAEIEFNAEMKKGSELFKHLEKLDFIKCDIEGHEEVVIPEIEPLLLKFRPILLIESRGDSRKNLLNFFKERSYNSFILNKGLLYHAKEDEFWDMLIVPHEKVNLIEKYIKISTDNNA